MFSLPVVPGKPCTNWARAAPGSLLCPVQAVSHRGHQHLTRKALSGSGSPPFRYLNFVGAGEFLKSLVRSGGYGTTEWT
jgi:hypothetical protein